MFKKGDIISPQNHMTIPAKGVSLTLDTQGEVVEADGDNLLVEWTLADGKKKRLPTGGFLMALSTKAEQVALEAKATTKPVNEEKLLASLPDDALRDIIMNLWARLAYLEKLQGIDHSAKG